MIRIKNKNGGGFTLIEVLIVIAIIGILLGIVLVAFNQTRAAARDAVRMSDLRTLEKILEMYKSDENRYPTSTINFQIDGHPWGSNWEKYGTVPKNPLSPVQDYVYVSDKGRDYQVYAKFEREPVNPTFACKEPCGPNAEYNGGISSVAATTTLIAFEPPPPPEGWPIVCYPSVALGERRFVGTTPNNPKINEITINPLNVNKFASSTVKVKILETAGYPVTEVKGEVKTNTMSFPFSLELIEGSYTDGTWQGSWYNEDGYCQNYMLIITATSASDSSKVVLTFR